MRAALRSAARHIDAWSQVNPRAVAVASGACCGVIGDSVAQRMDGHTNSHDLSRTARVATYYASAGVLFWIPFFGHLDSRWPSQKLGWRAVVAKTAATNALAMPLFDIPAFHICALGPRIGLEPALEQLRANYGESVVTAWALWIPTMAGVYCVVPTHFQLPAMYCVDCLWSCLLSLLGHRESPSVSEDAA